MKTVKGCMGSASMFIAVVSVYMGIDKTPNGQRIKDSNLGGMRTNIFTPIVGKRMRCTDCCLTVGVRQLKH